MERFTIFVASPGDVLQERDMLTKVVDEINLTHGDPMGYQLDLWRWEKNAYPSAENPQDLINSIITPYSIFIGIMWKRFGTPTKTAGSGTEEEYRMAFKTWEKNNDIAVMFYFRKQAIELNTEEEYKQYGKVMAFKNELNSKSLIWTYSDPLNFEAELRKHICLRMNRKMKMLKSTEKGSATKPNGQDINILKELWPRMDPDLQTKLSIAYNDNRMAGDGGIKTKDFFSAVLTNPSNELSTVINDIKTISENALPKPKGGFLIDEQYIIDEQPWLSHCVSASMKRLSKILPEGKQLTALDVFTDIAINGTGESVRQMRDNKIGPEQIESIIKKANLTVIGM